MLLFGSDYILWTLVLLRPPLACLVSTLRLMGNSSLIGLCIVSIVNFNSARHMFGKLIVCLHLLINLLSSKLRDLRFLKWKAFFFLLGKGFLGPCMWTFQRKARANCYQGCDHFLTLWIVEHFVVAIYDFCQIILFAILSLTSCTGIEYDSPWEDWVVVPTSNPHFLGSNPGNVQYFNYC